MISPQRRVLRFERKSKSESSLKEEGKKVEGERVGRKRKACGKKKVEEKGGGAGRRSREEEEEEEEVKATAEVETGEFEEYASIVTNSTNLLKSRSRARARR